MYKKLENEIKTKLGLKGFESPTAPESKNEDKSDDKPKGKKK
jgi:hypothetical protein